MRISLSRDDLRALFQYDPMSGDLLWKDTRRRGATSGRRAGCIDAAGYVVVRVFGRRFKSHRLVWLYVTGETPKGVIDHINGVKSDNRFSNLRDVTVQENLRNMPRQTNNKSGLPGVRWEKKVGKWVANIKVGGITRHIGTFDNLLCAASARKSAERKHGFHVNHGRFK